MEANTGFYNKNMLNPFADTFPDPLCKLNLKETSEFVKSFPMANHNTETRTYFNVSAQRRREGVSSVTKRNSVDAPPTPGRPIFSFSAGNLSRKGFPSKWDDAEKWLNNSSSSCHDSPAHVHGLNLKTSESSKFHKQFDGFRPQAEVFAEKSRVTEEKVSKAVSSIHGSVLLEHHSSSKDLNVDVLLKGWILFFTNFNLAFTTLFLSATTVSPSLFLSSKSLHVIFFFVFGSFLCEFSRLVNMSCSAFSLK